MARTDSTRSLDFVVGSDDDDDGITVSVVGEAHPRVVVTSAGVAVGDGSAAPVVQPAAPDASGEADGDYILQATVDTGVVTFAWVAAP